DRDSGSAVAEPARVRNAPREPPAAAAPPPQSAARAAEARGVAGSAASQAAPRIHALHELPEEVRRLIPSLVVNGSVYSKNPADRFLILNGQIVRESDTVAPDVVVEQIGLRSAVLSSLGFRFEISY
ncbi:MAG: general secretion pathway protein GspB, partial [Burkholderiaceae bacterium]